MIVQVDLQELAPLLESHRAEHRVRSPEVGGSCLPCGIDNLEQLLLFKVEVELRAVGYLETLRQAQAYGLFREPVHQNPSKQCSRQEIALIRKLVEAKCAATR